MKRASPDVLIAQAGQLPLDEFKGAGLKQIILVVEKAAQHLGWSGPMGKTRCVQYDEVVAKAAVPIDDLTLDLDAPAVIIFGPKIAGIVEMVEFSHRVSSIYSRHDITADMVARISLPALRLNPLFSPRRRSIHLKTFSFLSTRFRTCTLAFTLTSPCLLDP